MKKKKKVEKIKSRPMCLMILRFFEVVFFSWAPFCCSIASLLACVRLYYFLVKCSMANFIFTFFMFFWDIIRRMEKSLLSLCDSIKKIFLLHYLTCARFRSWTTKFHLKLVINVSLWRVINSQSKGLVIIIIISSTIYGWAIFLTSSKIILYFHS